MGDIKFDKKFSMKRLFRGKGFYLALALCLVAVCGVAVVTFLDSLPQANKGTVSTPSSRPTTPTTLHQVDRPVTNVPDPRTTASAGTTTTVSSATTTAVTANTTPADLFILPLSNEVLAGYSNGKLVYSQTMGDWRTHNGTDFKGEKNQQVKALADGSVLAVEEDPLWGNTVSIDHGFGIRSLYCGVSASGLKKGDKVKVGDVIGKLTDIPCEILEGPHLHLEITVNGAYADPVQAIGREVKTAATTTTTTAAATTTKK